MAPHLTGLDGGVSLRRLARGAKLSVANGSRINRGVIYLGPLQQEKWSVGRGG